MQDDNAVNIRVVFNPADIKRGADTAKSAISDIGSHARQVANNSRGAFNGLVVEVTGAASRARDGFARSFGANFAADIASNFARQFVADVRAVRRLCFQTPLRRLSAVHPR
jgi:hypothetical protein